MSRRWDGAMNRFRDKHFSPIKQISFVIAVLAALIQANNAVAETGGSPPVRVFLNAEESSATEVEISDNGRVIAAKTNKGTALIDAMSGRLIRRLNIDESDDVVSDVQAISPMANRVLVLQNDVYQLWDTVAGKAIVSLKDGVDTGAIRTDMSRDGKSLASIWRDKTTLRVWDTETGALRTSIKSGSSAIQDFVFLADSRYLATTSKDRTVRIWDTKDGTLVKSLATSNEEIGRASCRERV